MNIEIIWQKPIALKSRGKANQPLYLADENGWTKIAKKYGVYVFARQDYYNKRNYIPLYIGSSQNVHDRIMQHFKQSVSLIQHIRHNAGQGKKILIIGEIQSNRGQNTEKATKIVEKALIKKAVDDKKYKKYLFNKSGTNFKFHYIGLSGFNGANKIFGKEIQMPE